jgi:hypothetical protein
MRRLRRACIMVTYRDAALGRCAHLWWCSGGWPHLPWGSSASRAYVPGTVYSPPWLAGFSAFTRASSSSTRRPAGCAPSFSVWHATQLRARIGLMSRWYSTVFGPASYRIPVSPRASHLPFDSSAAFVVIREVFRVRSNGV